MNTATPIQDKRRLEELAPRLIKLAGGIGVVALLVSIAVAVLAEHGRHRFYHAYLVNFTYFLSLSLGALFFVILQHLTRSGWSVVVRRLAEATAAAVVPLAVLVIPVFVGMYDLYHWTHAEAVAGDHLLQAKQPYLNTPFFIIRCVVYFIIWGWMAVYFLRRSVEQDATGDPALTAGMGRISGPAMIVYAFTLTFAAFDLLMSGDPHWFSTIYGVYYFSGGVVGFLALLPLVLFMLQRSGRLTRVVTVEHYHDIGKLLLGFIVFWAYIAFSQYMLIWYANIPEETGWYLRRQTGSWTAVSLLLLFGHFVVPFLLLISRYSKRRPSALVAAAVWVLIIHWMDIYWLVMPEASPGQVGLHVLDLTCLVGLGGLFVASVAYWLRDKSLIPERDPRLPESLAFENS